MVNHPINIIKAVEDNIEDSIKLLSEKIESFETELDVLYIERAKLQRIRRNNGFKPTSLSLFKQQESSPIGQTQLEAMDNR